jgi:hypothetical protein
MAVRVTIEARDKQAAEIVARHLGTDASPKSRRGLGVIRMVAKNAAETAGIVDRVSGLLEERHDLGWVRVRYDDESRVFRSNGRKPA